MSTMGCIAVNAGDRRLSDEAVRCLLQHEHHTHGRSNLVIYISWTDHRTNEWVLSRLEVEKSLLARIRKLKLSYYGHIVRKANCLEKDIIQGCVPGSRGRGRPRRRWREDISDWTGLRINDAARSAEDRDNWRTVIRAANPSTVERQ